MLPEKRRAARRRAFLEKEGPPEGGPGSGTDCRTEWEESVPIRAPDAPTTTWLNATLMRWTFPDAARLQDMMEGKAARNPLRLDSQGARRQQFHVAAPEAAAGTVILDYGEIARLAMTV